MSGGGKRTGQQDQILVCGPDTGDYWISKLSACWGTSGNTCQYMMQLQIATEVKKDLESRVNENNLVKKEREREAGSLASQPQQHRPGEKACYFSSICWCVRGQVCVRVCVCLIRDCGLRKCGQLFQVHKICTMFSFISKWEKLTLN